MDGFALDDLRFSTGFSHRNYNSYESATLTMGPGDTASLWQNLTETVGCSNSTDGLACTRTLPDETLRDRCEDLQLMFTATEDGVTWTKTPRADRASSTAADPTIARVPVLGGSNADEGAIFTPGQTANSSAYLLSAFGSAALAAALAPYYYPVGSRGTDTERARAARLGGDIGFVCPAGVVAGDTRAVGVPAWRYCFNATFPNALGSVVPGAGVCHGAELPAVFDTYAAAGETAFQAAVTAAMQRAWGDFVKDPSAGPGWDQFPAVGMFGGGARAGDEGDEERQALEVIDSEAIDVICPLLTPIVDAMP